MPRSTPPRATRALVARIAALEERVARLEERRPPPGDGRTTRRIPAGVEAGATEARKRRTRVRCAGCGLPLRRRKGRCAECGRPLDA